jgi:hypothetical protein
MKTGAETIYFSFTKPPVSPPLLWLFPRRGGLFSSIPDVTVNLLLTNKISFCLQLISFLMMLISLARADLLVANCFLGGQG